MEFHKGTDVYTAGGDKAGQIDRVVIDPASKEVTHIVVRQGFLFTEDVVLPIEVVQDATNERVTLTGEFDPDLEDWPVFEETHYVPLEGADPAEVQTTTDPRPAQPYFWYPPVGAARPGYIGAPYYPGYSVDVERNIPEGAAALEEGANVYSADDEHIGDVERVLTDSETDKVTHLVISRGLLFKSHKLIPANWVVDVTDEDVYLSVRKDVLEKLPDYEEEKS